MSLSDEVAAKVLGEIYKLTKQIDEQQDIVISTADFVKNAAYLIKQNSELAVTNAREATELAQLESLAHFEQNMSESVAQTLNDVAGAVATKSAARWVVAGVALAGILSVFSGWIGYSKGKDAGTSFGYSQARSEIAAVAWANTPNGKLAYQLAQAGSIEYLARCSRPGWKKIDNVCYGYALTNEGAYGWYVH